MCYIKPHEIIIQAEVPDKLVLLHDADAWSDGPFSSMDLGWRGHKLYNANDWTGTNYEELFDKLWDRYKKNPEAMIETWTEIFNIRKAANQRIHATTQFIDLYWLESKPIKSEPSLSMET